MCSCCQAVTKLVKEPHISLCFLSTALAAVFSIMLF